MLTFEVLVAMKMPVLVFWVVTPCGIVGVDINILEKHMASMFTAEGGGGMFL
jgi:hypothetical protein